jgi:hypothetical protein
MCAAPPTRNSVLRNHALINRLGSHKNPDTLTAGGRSRASFAQLEPSLRTSDGGAVQFERPG